MFEKYKKYFEYLRQLQAPQGTSGPNKKESYGSDALLTGDYDKDTATLKGLLGGSADVVCREFWFGESRTRAYFCFIDGLDDKPLIDEYILKSLLVNLNFIEQQPDLPGNIDRFSEIQHHILNALELSESNSFDEIVGGALAGNTILLVDGCNRAFIISAKGGKYRNVEETQTEVGIRGPRDGFNEILRVNTSLVRRKLKNPNLIFESFRLGRQTHTDVEIAYIKGIANNKIIEEVRRRLNRIDTDTVLESGYIEQFIEDAPLSPFSTIRNTERPDKVAAKLLEGRVAIFCDGTPFVLTVPHLFIENFQVPEDYYARSFLGSFLRLLRYLAYFITMMLPALYVALETYNQDMIPTVLLITAASARETTPFPAFLETVIMIVTFEMLRESGVRLPRQVGQAVSIVGALVIGEAAVRAGLVSAPLIIITAVMGVASFMVPALLDSVIIFRFFLLFCAASFGLFGICVGVLFILGYMCSLRSFGVPYLAPLAPMIRSDLKDSVIRLPLWLMKLRPQSLKGSNAHRQGTSAMPNKPSE